MLDEGFYEVFREDLTYHAAVYDDYIIWVDLDEGMITRDKGSRNNEGATKGYEFHYLSPLELIKW